MEANKGNRVILFTFPSQGEILRWLRAEGQVSCERSCLALSSFEKVIASTGRHDHIETVRKAKANPKCIVLVIICRDGGVANILSITAVEQVSDPSLFEEFRARHSPSLYALEK